MDECMATVKVLIGDKTGWVHTSVLKIGHDQYAWYLSQKMTNILSSSMLSTSKQLASDMTIICQRCNKSKDNTCPESFLHADNLLEIV